LALLVRMVDVKSVGLLTRKMVRSYLKNIFWPKFCVVLAFQVLKIL